MSSDHSYCRRDGWQCTPSNRCDEHRRRIVLRASRALVPGSPWTSREWATFRAGYDLGWNQGYTDGGAYD